MEIKYNFKLFTFLNIAFFILALLIPKIIGESYRFTNHDLWSFSRMATFTLFGISLLMTLLNVILLLPNFKQGKNLVLLILNIPIIVYWIWVFAMM
jgi:hypothetical protein